MVPVIFIVPLLTTQISPGPLPGNKQKELLFPKTRIFLVMVYFTYLSRYELLPKSRLLLPAICIIHKKTGYCDIMFVKGGGVNLACERGAWLWHFYWSVTWSDVSGLHEVFANGRVKKNFLSCWRYLRFSRIWYVKFLMKCDCFFKGTTLKAYLAHSRAKFAVRLAKRSIPLWMNPLYTIKLTLQQIGNFY